MFVHIDWHRCSIHFWMPFVQACSCRFTHTEKGLNFLKIRIRKYILKKKKKKKKNVWLTWNASKKNCFINIYFMARYPIILQKILASSAIGNTALNPKGALAYLVQRDISLPMAGSLELDDLKGPFNPNHSMILLLGS